MSMPYGINRVLEPKHVLPTSAWKLDNNRSIYSDELKVSIQRIHLEGTGFKQICTESNDDEKKICLLYTSALKSSMLQFLWLRAALTSAAVYLS